MRVNLNNINLFKTKNINIRCLILYIDCPSPKKEDTISEIKKHRNEEILAQNTKESNDRKYINSVKNGI